VVKKRNIISKAKCKAQPRASTVKVTPKAKKAHQVSFKKKARMKALKRREKSFLKVAIFFKIRWMFKKNTQQIPWKYMRLKILSSCLINLIKSKLQDNPSQYFRNIN